MATHNVAELVAGWRDLPPLVLDRSTYRPTPSIYAPPDLLAPLVARYPDLPERIRRMRAGLPNPPLVLVGECSVCGRPFGMRFAGGRDRRYCSRACAVAARRARARIGATTRATTPAAARSPRSVPPRVPPRDPDGYPARPKTARKR